MILDTLVLERENALVPLNRVAALVLAYTLQILFAGSAVLRDD